MPESETEISSINIDNESYNTHALLIMDCLSEFMETMKLEFKQEGKWQQQDIDQLFSSILTTIKCTFTFHY